MAHQLAEAICELAAPPVRPTVLRLRAYFSHDESFALLLHVRPRGGLAAGVEVAVHLSVSSEGGEECSGPAAADRYILEAPPGAPPSAGVEAFVRTLITGGGWSYYWQDYSEPYSLRLADDPSYGSSGWTGVDLALFDAADVSVEAAPAAGGHAMRAVRFPPFPERVLATQFRWAASRRYKQQQEVLKKRARERGAQGDAAAAGGGAGGAGGAAPDYTGTAAAAVQRLRTALAELPEPDSSAEFLSRWAQLVSLDERWLHDTLAAMLRLACTYRGRAQLAAAPPPPAEQAGDSGSAGGGEPAEGAA